MVHATCPQCGKSFHKCGSNGNAIYGGHAPKCTNGLANFKWEGVSANE